ncbi:MAG: polyprenyl synthetase family protein [Oscillospiraceae bacterium]|nr:polyprenyl synthetase family protein [Oscillospiraceae bacterium]
MDSGFLGLYGRYRGIVDDALVRMLPEIPGDALRGAMRYALLGGGKRVRGVAFLAVAMGGVGGGVAADAAEGGEGPAGVAVRFACAAEMAHAYSLIHDDLPCMDDDDMRRGKPSCHVAYGEAMALLAGDALQSKAYECMIGALAPSIGLGLDGEACAAVLGAAIGEAGMVGGQAREMAGVGGGLDATLAMYAMKTGALLEACVTAPAALMKVDGAGREALKAYGRAFGLLYQLRDDLMDVVGDTGRMGKKVGRDERKGKVTVPTILGVEGTEKRIKDLLGDAMDALARAGGLGTGFLPDLAEYAAYRDA